VKVAAKKKGEQQRKGLKITRRLYKRFKENVVG